jgi:hypothetical protein
MHFAAALLVATLLGHAGAVAAQSVRKVAGLEIEYGFAFREDEEFSRRAFEAAKTANPHTRSVQVFEAPTLTRMGGGSGSFHIVKTVHGAPPRETLEELSARAFRFIADSDAKVKSRTFEPIPMKGYESGRISFEADQGKWRIGGEMVLILDRQRGVQWQLQYIFGKQRISSIVSPNLDSNRRHARNVLASAKVVEP